MTQDPHRRRKIASLGLVIAAALTMVTAALVSTSTTATAVVGATTVTIDGQSHAITGENVRRTTDALVLYSSGATTGTNEYGFEAAVVNGKVTQVANGVGNMAIPSGGYVLSGHGTSRTWLRDRAQVGDTVSLNGNSTGGTPLLPDLGVRVLRQFTIQTPTSGEFAGRKLLKFPTVTANVGSAYLEIRGQRSSSTSTDWAARQVVKNTDGSSTTLPPAPGATFVFGGDGHNHWHIRDFNQYTLFDANGKKVATGAKRGFCFEDNTSYRDWPSTGKNGSPANPVYVPPSVCTVGQPQATATIHGLSVGWSDTYPATLPDQAIDITGIPNGVYVVQVDVDWQKQWAETNESNNGAQARVQISGNTVTLLGTTGGL